MNSSNISRRNKSRSQFEEIVVSKGGTVLGTYINDKTKIKISCVKGHIWEVVPSSTKRGRWCRKCPRKYDIVKKDEARKRFQELVESKGGIVLGNYINANTQVLLGCFNGHQWEGIPGNIWSGRWCPRCEKSRTINSQTRFKEIINQREGKIIEAYQGSQVKILIECKNGHQWKVVPSSIIQGYWCAKCSGTDTHDAKISFEEIVKERRGLIIEPYQNAKTEILIQCESAHQWKARPDNIKQGTWCPICKGSFLEREAKLFLEQLEITYEREYKILQLPRKRYDFYFKYNNNKILLELDGKQHFEYVSYFHKTVESFQYHQNIDQLKTHTALKFGYKLIRIDYTQSNGIQEHILKGLATECQLYLSSPLMYEYLSPPSILKYLSSPLMINI